MAIFLRRAFSLRNLLLPRSSALCGRELRQCSLETPPQRILPLPALEFVNERRRGFAKGHNKKDQKKKDDKKDKPPVEPLRNVAPTIKANASSQMEMAIAALIGELSKLRTGRAAPGMLDHIIVETGGVKLPLNQVALVSVMDSKTLSINPFDPSALKNLETAIVDCPLGINPKVGDNRLIAEIPPLTKEHVQAICKVVTKSCEDGKLSIRRARQKAIDIIKKMYNDYSKDDLKRLEKEVDDITKEFVKQAEDLCKAKEKEISSG